MLLRCNNKDTASGTARIASVSPAVVPLTGPFGSSIITLAEPQPGRDAGAGFSLHRTGSGEEFPNGTVAG